MEGPHVYKLGQYIVCKKSYSNLDDNNLVLLFSKMRKSLTLFAQIALVLASPQGFASSARAANDTALHFEAEDAQLSGNTKVLTELEGFTGARCLLYDCFSR